MLKKKKERYIIDKLDLKKEWQIFLLDTNLNNTIIAGGLGTSPQVLGRKINSGSIKFLELANILEKYGYEISIRKKSDS